MDDVPILSPSNTACQTFIGAQNPAKDVPHPVGSVTPNRLPLPRVLSTAIVPCSSYTFIPCQTESRSGRIPVQAATLSGTDQPPDKGAGAAPDRAAVFIVFR
jgi:hypothetical protein